jgi:hypothetical protein
MKIHSGHLLKSLVLVSVFSLLFYLGLFIDARTYGLHPGDLKSPLSIFTFVFVHSSQKHLISNLSIFVPISFILFYFYNKASFKVIFWLILLNGSLLFFLGRGDNVHIGSSGLIYGISSFVLIVSLLKANKSSLVILTLALFISHRIFLEVVPISFVDIDYSWESHFIGFLTGVMLGFIYGWDPLSSFYPDL